jgi:tetraacyldisaccharide 4'-kinase
MQASSPTKPGSLAIFWQESVYSGAGWLQLLRPFSWLFRIATRLRRFFYRYLFAHKRSPVPVIVVGNITVGGTGKTPLLIALAVEARRRGLRVGIVSRGYGGSAGTFPLTLDAGAAPAVCGDEPAMIVQRLGVPVVVDPDRARAVATLEGRCDVILSDDGLQHYAMPRDIEIVVVDAVRGFGNGLCLPAGPLREPLSRLRTVDYRVAQGADAGQCLPQQQDFVAMQLKPTACVNVTTGERMAIEPFFRQHPRVHAVAGIGHPQRFFSTLRTLGTVVIEHPFPDHFHYAPSDLQFAEAFPVVMTEKDAVKCRQMNLQQAWYVEVDASLPETFFRAVFERLEAVRQQRKLPLQRGILGH